MSSNAHRTSISQLPMWTAFVLYVSKMCARMGKSLTFIGVNLWKVTLTQGC